MTALNGVPVPGGETIRPPVQLMWPAFAGTLPIAFSHLRLLSSGPKDDVAFLFSVLATHGFLLATRMKKPSRLDANIAPSGLGYLWQSASGKAAVV